MPRPYTEADAHAYAARVGVRVETARTTLGIQPQAFSTDVPLWPDQSDAVRAYAAERGLSVHQALKALHADGNRTSAAVAASAVATFNRANQIEPSKSPHRTRSAEVADAAPRIQPPAQTTRTAAPSDAEAAEARAIACQAAAASAVAIFKKFNGDQHG